MSLAMTCILAASMSLPGAAVPYEPEERGGPGEPGGPGARHVTCDLIVPSRQLAAGSTTIIGVRFRIAPEWHLYWNGQNDSGAAPTLDFSGSDPRLTFGAALWPVPKRHVAEGDIVDHIYRGECVLLVPLTVEKGIGGPVAIKVRSEILVCREACLPGRVGATANVDVGVQAGPRGPGATTLDEATAALPLPMRSDTPFDARIDEGALIVEPQQGRRLSRLTFMPGPGCEATTLHPDCESRAEGDASPRLSVTLVSGGATGIMQCEDVSGAVTNWRVELKGRERPASPAKEGESDSSK